MRAQSLSAVLLLVELREATVGGRGTDVFRVPGPTGGRVCEFETGVEVKPNLLMMGRGGGMFSLSADNGTLILGVFALRGLAKEGLRKRPSFPFRLGLSLAIFESLLESIPELDSDFLVSPLSRLAPADWEIVAVLLIDPALFFAKPAFFLTGMTIPSPPSPKRENLGVGSVRDIQFSLGSRETEGGCG